MSEEQSGTESQGNGKKVGATISSIKDSPKKKKKDGPSQIEIIDDFVHAIKSGLEQTYFLSGWPAFGQKLHVIRDEIDNPRLVKENTHSVLQNISNNAIIYDILAYSRQVPHLSHSLLKKTAVEVRDLFLGRAGILNETSISPVLEKSQSGLCWHRLDWDLADGPTPTFDEIMQRMSNAKAFMAFVGSLFIKDSDRQQYVWIMGDGNDSKSSIGRFLAEVMGPSYRAEYVPSQGRPNNFWTAAFLGKRLAVFPDCDAYSFPTTGLFKSLTGDDPIRVEYKGQQSFTAKIPTKFLYFGNGDPEIGSGRANQRRLIYCRLTKVAGELLATQTYHQKLWAEGAAWLWKCRKEYLEMTNNGMKPIPADGGEVAQIISETEEQFETTFNQYFVKSEIKVPHHESAYITPEALQIFMKKCMGWDQHQQTKFRRWLKREQGVSKHSVKLDKGEIERRYLGAEWSAEMKKTNPNWIKKEPSPDMKTKGDGNDSF